jgi:hypothetical protein
MTEDSLQHSLGFRIDHENIQEGNYSSMLGGLFLCLGGSRAYHGVIACLIFIGKVMAMDGEQVGVIWQE